MDSSRQAGQRHGSGGRGGRRIRRSQWQRSQLLRVVYLSRTVESGAFTRESSRLEFFWKIQVARFPTCGCDQIPLSIGRAFMTAEMYLVENAFTVRRDRNRQCAAKAGRVIKAEGMTRGLTVGGKCEQKKKA